MRVMNESACHLISDIIRIASGLSGNCRLPGIP